MLRWQIAPSITFHHWSFGQVQSDADLYSQRTFGPAKDLSCECGKFAGNAEWDNMICDRCGVKIAADSQRLRKSRLGHIDLALSIPHPFDDRADVVDSFPICPVAFRVDSDGNPNELGRRYERVIEANADAAARLPERSTLEYFQALRTFDSSALQEALASLVGKPITPQGATVLTVDPNSILGQLLLAITNVDPAVSALVHSLGCTLRVEGTL